MRDLLALVGERTLHALKWRALPPAGRDVLDRAGDAWRRIEQLAAPPVPRQQGGAHAHLYTGECPLDGPGVA
eukprot:7335707-Prymnesium_polylepis.1